jgi:succinoglycan biosynthesis protein ExoH
VTHIVKIDQELSARINIARLLLIAGIVFVHVPFDQDSNAYLGQYGAFDWVRVFLRDVIFRIGVPCLSAISGLLLFRNGLETLNYRRILSAKFASLFLPFLLWNAVFLLGVTLLQVWDLGLGYFPTMVDASYRELANLVFATEAMPINLPLYFLRDLLLCILMAPVIGYLVKHYPLTTLSVLLIYVVLPVPNLIFLKKSIVLGFACGATVALHGINIKKLDEYAVPLIAAIVVAALILFVALFANGLDQRPVWLHSFYKLMTVVGGLGAWTMTRLLLDTRLGQALVRAPAGLSFWIFCTHYPIMMMAWLVWGKMNIDYYPLFYVAVLPLTFALALASHHLAQQFAPRLYALTTGQRTSSRTPAISPQMTERARLVLEKGD